MVLELLQPADEAIPAQNVRVWQIDGIRGLHKMLTEALATFDAELAKIPTDS